MSAPQTTTDQQAQPLLEEIVELLHEQSPPTEALAAGTLITAPNTCVFRVITLVTTEPQYRIYEGSREDDNQAVCLREALSEAAAACLRHEAQVLESMDCRIFPKSIGCFDTQGRTIHITEPVPTEHTFSKYCAGPTRPLREVLSTLAQISFGLAQLHERGWVHLGLRPNAIALGKPIKILDLSYSTRIGEPPSRRFYHAGYSCPEILGQEPVDARADVYSVGALLYHAINGRAIPETGADSIEWNPPVPIAGVPQILHRCLGTVETRFQSMGELHRALVRLTRRLAAPPTYTVYGASTIGLEPTRTTNQDAYAHLSGRLESDVAASAWAVVCIADGMGGMASGEVASEAAARTVMSNAAIALSTWPPPSAQDQIDLVKQWVHAANESAHRALEAKNARGGTTLLCACIVDGRLTIAHVGDTRLYLFRNGDVTLLTRDHSLAMAHVMQGTISLEELRRHPDRSTVTRSLGDRAVLPAHAVDTLEQTTGSSVMELKSGDILLFATDGLWEPVLEEDMARIAQQNKLHLSVLANGLLETALQRGGPDNATVVLLLLEVPAAPTEE